MNAGEIVDECVDSMDLEAFRKVYEEQKKRGEPSTISTFNFAHALIRSTKENVRSGIELLENLLKKDITEGSKRDYVYYLAVANARLKEYDQALKFVDVLMESDEDNRQAVALKELIEQRMKKGSLYALGVLGLAAVVGIVPVAIGSLIMYRRRQKKSDS